MLREYGACCSIAVCLIAGWREHTKVFVLHISSHAQWSYSTSKGYGKQAVFSWLLVARCCPALWCQVQTGGWLSHLVWAWMVLRNASVSLQSSVFSQQYFFLCPAKKKQSGKFLHSSRGGNRGSYLLFEQRCNVSCRLSALSTKQANRPHLVALWGVVAGAESLSRNALIGPGATQTATHTHIHTHIHTGVLGQTSSHSWLTGEPRTTGPWQLTVRSY